MVPVNGHIRMVVVEEPCGYTLGSFSYWAPHGAWKEYCEYATSSGSLSEPLLDSGEKWHGNRDDYRARQRLSVEVLMSRSGDSYTFDMKRSLE